ncbi:MULTISPECIES: preprotein translocase subunit SecE [Vitreoscilla]|uniref:Preprotein translocase subunit SecE n=1 Tax=Vitreoscilla stercoraria TaxID=61 RepID=A0ABY4EFU4_VITST|nr:MULTISPECIES: preprotein translocase subunit SecE [Vitreoscilla]AUZ06458.1 subunit SecE of preprotein translocase [Vitreoscilla sp. C1]UOO92262.1 preprotein translocase subunit SecE [Vitreoscilla stercoraria]
MDNQNQPEKVVKRSKAELKAQAQAEVQKNKTVDMVKIIAALLVVVASVWAYYALPQLNVYVRGLITAAGVAIAVAIVFFATHLGKRLVAYVKGAFVELNKVVWPERPEAMRTTLYVVAFVATLAGFMWMADSLIAWVFYDLLLKRG